MALKTFSLLFTVVSVASELVPGVTALAGATGASVTGPDYCTNMILVRASPLHSAPAQDRPSSHLNGATAVTAPLQLVDALEYRNFLGE